MRKQYQKVWHRDAANSQCPCWLPSLLLRRNSKGQHRHHPTTSTASTGIHTKKCGTSAAHMYTHSHPLPTVAVNQQRIREGNSSDHRRCVLRLSYLVLLPPSSTTYERLHIHIHINVCAQTCTHVYINTRIYVHLYVGLHTYIHKCIHTSMHTYIHACIAQIDGGLLAFSHVTDLSRGWGGTDVLWWQAAGGLD